MKALMLIAAALLGGHHQLHHQSGRLYEMTTAQQCGPGIVGAPRLGYRVKCIGGLVTVTRLYYSPNSTAAELPGTFRTVSAYNRFGRRVGSVQWRVTGTTDGVRHLAVGVFDWATQSYDWQFS